MPQTVHYLKTWPIPFTAVKEGLKTFEHRFNDRDFKVGDILILTEYLPTKGGFTGKEVEREVIYVMEGDKFGIEPGFVCMSIIPVRK